MNACLFKKRDFFFVTGAMGCKTEVSGEDPDQYDAIQCCHQSELFDSIDSEDNCSRWLCNGCRIKLGISTSSTWFCSDHEEMHMHTDDEE